MPRVAPSPASGSPPVPTPAAPGHVALAVVAPTFNNATTVRAVLDGLAPLDRPIIVVDDGCTDDTAEVLADWCAARPDDGPDRIVLTHASNQGKAAAMQTGFAEALRRGWTHALTIDTDGQLDPAEAARLVAEAEGSPRALIVGNRDDTAPDYPPASRIGRRVTNVLIRLESGCRVADSQCGYRVYPLELLADLDLRSGRYEFESECIVRAAWAGIAVRDVPVTCRYDLDQGLVSHFQPWRETLRSSKLHLRLLARTHWPIPVKRVADVDPSVTTGTIAARLMNWVSPRRAWREARRDGVGRTRFSFALGLGVFIANLPIYGAQIAMSLLLARWLRLHPLPVVVGAHVSTPPIGPLLIVSGIAVGHRTLHGEWPSLDPASIGDLGFLEIVRMAVVEWIVGGTILGVALGALTVILSMAVLGVVGRR
ncbi:MAG: DUF2062 domain-containing protein [Planctomycetota bacterium]